MNHEGDEPQLLNFCWKEYKMDLGGHMVPRAEWATFGVPIVFGGCWVW